MPAPTAEPPPAEQATRRNRNGDGNTAEGAAAPEPPKLRRRPMLIAVSVLLTALGALLGAFLLSTLSGTDDYVAVRADIERGDVIKETDLVRTQLRRTRPATMGERLSFQDIILDSGEHRVFRSGKSLHLGPTEFRLLDHFMRHPGRVFTRDQLESYIRLKWEEVYAYEHTPHPIEYAMYYSC